jgi:hypothetical protein
VQGGATTATAIRRLDSSSSSSSEPSEQKISAVLSPREAAAAAAEARMQQAKEKEMELKRAMSDPPITATLVGGGGGGGAGGGMSEPVLVAQPVALRKRRTAAELLREWEVDAAALRFDPSKPLASGGQADVFLGTLQREDKGDGRGARQLAVAIKVARPASEAAKAFYASFLRREVRGLSRCRHPNVIQLLGVCSSDPICVVMPVAAGGNLRDRLQCGGGGASSPPRSSAAIPVPEALPLLLGIAKGMSCVHKNGIIHLDLKPENILFSSDGTPWITDFGLATSASEGSFSNSAGGRGTLQYKAPELFRSKRRGGAITSPAADVYSFGVLAWQVCTGCVPWDGEMDTEIMEGVKDGDRPSVEGVEDWKTVMAGHSELAELIERCWGQEHTARPGFEEVARTLEALQVQTARHGTAAGELAVIEQLQRRAAEAESIVAEMRARMAEYEAAIAAEGLEKKLTAAQLETLRSELDGMRMNTGGAAGGSGGANGADARAADGGGGGGGGAFSPGLPALNAPGRWDFFVSHTRRSGRATTLATKLWAHLGEEKTWLDVEMDDKSEAAMREGVVNSTVVLAVVTDDAGDGNAYFERPFCISELRWAAEAGVFIQPVIAAEDKTKISDFLAKAPEDLRILLGGTDFIDLITSDREYLSVGINKVRKILEKQKQCPSRQ